MSKKNTKHKFSGTGLNAKEKHWAEKRFEEYKTYHHVESLSDLYLLEELVYREALQEKTKQEIVDLSRGSSEDKKTSMPRYMIEALDNNLDKIIELKTKLGLFEEKKEEDSPYKYIEDLKKKFKIWLDENQASRTLICPHCSKMILLKIKTDAWEAQKHPMFKDRILGNEHLIQLYVDKKITKDDVAKVLGVSNTYADWLVSKFTKQIC